MATGGCKEPLCTKCISNTHIIHIYTYVVSLDRYVCIYIYIQSHTVTYNHIQSHTITYNYIHNSSYIYTIYIIIHNCTKFSCANLWVCHFAFLVRTTGRVYPGPRSQCRLSGPVAGPTTPMSLLWPVLWSVFNNIIYIYI